MVIFLQYTLTDTRSMTERRDEMLGRPSWPSPAPFQEFVRGSGQIIERTKKGLTNWIGENFICRIRRGLRIPAAIKVANDSLLLKNVGKHQYASEQFILNKYEFAFTSRKKFPNLTYPLLDQLVKQLLTTEVFVRADDYTYAKTTFQQFPKQLKRFHLLNTTRKEKLDPATQLPYLHLASPQVYIYLDQKETVSISPKKAATVTGKVFPFTLHGLWYNYQNNPLRVWIHEQLPGGYAKGVSRELRMSILRFHSEFECLKIIFKSIEAGQIDVAPFSPQSHILQAYLNRAISTLLSDEASVNNQNQEDDFVFYFTYLFSQMQPGGFETLRQKIKSFNLRPQIEHKAFTYIAKLEVMNNKYEATNSQVGAMGDGATATNNTFTQGNYAIPPNLDYDALLLELQTLKKELKTAAETPEEMDAVKNIAQAEEEAKKKNGNGVVNFLKAGGKWVVDTATKIGVTVVTELLKKNIGL